ncbi:disulfide bond formation protein B [Priestia aryabhattai]|uniref:disulfide oxidoreductase n=1 Tax=Priestia sp. GS2 TaxID=3117403 RepID=UPI000BA0B780|nr:disulfide bond formation protein B [Priestia aryabhattai]USY53707.1 disulfide oxidoreductase [Bacillus sp. 1780r2a1]
MKKTLIGSWIVAIVATLGSLSFSELFNFIPCTFCWYQRILMYPLVLILGVAVYEQNDRICKYVLPFSVVGMLVSGYHYALQKIPALQAFETCTSGIPCSGQYINWLGFITIPFLAFVAFTIITVLMVMLKRQK